MTPSGRDKSRNVSSPGSLGEGEPLGRLETSSVTLQQVMMLQGIVGGLCKQMEHVEARLEDVSRDVRKHGTWIAIASVITTIGVTLLGWLGSQALGLLKIYLERKP